MSFFNTKLAKQVMEGNLPEVKAEVSIETKSIQNLGIMIMSVGVGIALLVIAVKRIS